MLLSLIAAVTAAVCYGVATVFQALAARRATHRAAADPGKPSGLRLLAAVMGQWLFIGGTLLDTVGFAAQFIALRDLPVFAVQSAQAANLAVTAVVAVPVLGVRLNRREWGAVAGVCIGLGLLGLAAGKEGPSDVPDALRWSLLASVAVLTAVSAWATRLAEPRRSRVLGLICGLGFGVVALGARTITDYSPSSLLTNPSVYAVAAGGAITLAVYATALQGGAVTAVASAVVVGETVLPAAVGILFLGDHSRSGFVPVAVLGFVMAIGGALLLSRFGEVEGHNAPTEPAEPTT